MPRPRDYRWSSYPANAEGRADPLIRPHEQYLRLGQSALLRREAYRALFKTQLDEHTLGEIREATNGNYALGNPRFQAQIGAALGRLAQRDVVGCQRQTPK